MKKKWLRGMQVFGEENKMHMSKNIFNFSFTRQCKTKVKIPRNFTAKIKTFRMKTSLPHGLIKNKVSNMLHSSLLKKNSYSHLAYNLVTFLKKLFYCDIIS